jgi:hypothetical protein
VQRYEVLGKRPPALRTSERPHNRFGHFCLAGYTDS